MKNLRIRIKLLVTFMTIIVLFCATVTVAIIGLQRNSDSYSDFYNVGYQVTNRIMNMRRGLQIIVKDLGLITIQEDSAKCAEYQADMEKELELLQENGNWVFSHFQGNPEMLENFSESITKAVEMQATIIGLTATDMKAAQEMLLNEYQPLITESVDALIQISNVANANADDSYQETKEMQNLLVAAQLGMAGIALVITLVLSAYLTNIITRPLRELEVSAGKILEGDFDIQITYESKDELGRLAAAFKNMTSILGNVITDASRLLEEMANGNFDVRTRAEECYVGAFQGLLLSIRKLNRDLSFTLGQINLSSDQVASGANQVSGGAQSLSQGATEQAASVEELAATIGDISRQVKETAENASGARNQSNTAGTEAEKCNAQMKELTVAMEEITRTSDEISKIIKTISDIAFQTTILALNAAVEATRAGAAGKGFAVVASEVRSLASKSSEASKNTADLIENSIEAVAHGTQLAKETAESLLKVVGDVQNASSMVDKIASAAEDQAGAIEQVTLGVDQISSVVLMTSATAQESAAASEELSSQAEMLKSLVAKFKLREEYARSASGGIQL